MTATMSFHEVKSLVEQLPVAQQLQIAAQICEQLSRIDVAKRANPTVDEWLAQCDAIAEQIGGGQFDSAEDLRKIRDESSEAQE